MRNNRKVLAALSAVLILVPSAYARTNASCIATADHVLELLDAREGVEAGVLSSLKSFKTAQEQSLDVKIVEAAKAYNMDAAAMSQTSLQERAAMSAQMEKRFGMETLYLDHLIMLSNCAKTSTEDELGQSKARFDDTVTKLQAELG